MTTIAVNIIRATSNISADNILSRDVTVGGEFNANLHDTHQYKSLAAIIEQQAMA
jgi:hypothetical protein